MGFTSIFLSTLNLEMQLFYNSIIYILSQLKMKDSKNSGNDKQKGLDQIL